MPVSLSTEKIDLLLRLTAPASQRRPTGDHAGPSLPGAGHKSWLDSKFELEVHKGELSRSRAIGRRPKQGVGDLTCATDQSGCVGCFWECGREGEDVPLTSRTICRPLRAHL